MSQNYGTKRIVPGAHYGLRDWLAQRITAVLMALFTIVLLALFAPVIAPQDPYDQAALDLFDLAAAYAYGLAANHPFNAGNKRTAWGCCVLFLKVNGVGLEVAAPDAVERMLRLVAGGLDEAGFAAWLRARRMG